MTATEAANESEPPSRAERDEVSRVEDAARRSGAGIEGVPASDGARGSGGTKSPGLIFDN